MTESILTIVSAIVLLGIVALILKYARRSAKITEKVAALAERSYELRVSLFCLILIHGSFQWQYLDQVSFLSIIFPHIGLLAVLEPIQRESLESHELGL